MQLADGSSSKADVAKVQSISVAGTGQSANLYLLSNLTVSNTVTAKMLYLATNPDTIIEKTLTVQSGGTFTVAECLQLSRVELTLGSSTGHDVTATVNLVPNNSSFISNSTINNYGRLTFDGAAFGEDGNTGTIINNVDATLEVKNTALDYAGVLSNSGTLKFLTSSVSVTPMLYNHRLLQVYSTTANFTQDIWQSLPVAEFQLRNATVRVDAGAKKLMVREGALTGVGTIDGTVEMGVPGEQFYSNESSSTPALRPGLIDPAHPTNPAYGTIAITKDFTIWSNRATVTLEVWSGTTADQVTVGGEAILRGTAQVNIDNGYTPAFGTQVSLITAAGGVTVPFGTVNITGPGPWLAPPNPGLLRWASGYNATNFLIQVQN